MKYIYLDTYIIHKYVGMKFVVNIFRIFLVGRQYDNVGLLKIIC